MSSVVYLIVFYVTVDQILSLYLVILEIFLLISP